MNTSDLILPQFTWHDYVFFVILLLISSIIAIYFGFIKKEASTVDEYLLGGKTMGAAEISMSLIASSISGNTIIILPTEIYRTGIHYWLITVSICGVLFFSYKCTMPVFAKLHTPSTFEYLNSRFDKNIRGIASILNTFAMLLYMPMVMYLPVLALAQGTGFNVNFATPVICAVCIFYTAIGGLKAVVWTDALQLVVMTGAVLVVAYLGTMGMGVRLIWNEASERGMLDFDFDPLPTKRDTFWTVLIGMWFFWHGFISFNQGYIQKCMALPKRHKIRTAYLVFAIGIILFFFCCTYIGLLMSAKYKHCDPFTSRQINAHDQILPLYILQVTGSTPGLPGVFIAGVFSASLSTFSASMNALACTLYEDFIRGHLPEDASQRKVNLILKTIIVVIGVLCTALMFIMQYFNSLLEIGITAISLTQGPLIGLFILGMFVPKANTKGAYAGVVGSMCIMGWIIFTTLYYKWGGYIPQPALAVSVDECILAPNTTFRDISMAKEWTPPAIYRVSHYYYTLMGVVLVNLIGIPISYLTRNKKEVDPLVRTDLISPVMHWMLKNREYYSVKNANQKVVID